MGTVNLPVRKFFRNTSPAFSHADWKTVKTSQCTTGETFVSGVAAEQPRGKYFLLLRGTKHYRAARIRAVRLIRVTFSPRYSKREQKKNHPHDPRELEVGSDGWVLDKIHRREKRFESSGSPIPARFSLPGQPSTGSGDSKLIRRFNFPRVANGLNRADLLNDTPPLRYPRVLIRGKGRGAIRILRRKRPATRSQAATKPHGTFPDTSFPRTAPARVLTSELSKSSLSLSPFEANVVRSTKSDRVNGTRWPRTGVLFNNV